MRSLLGIALAVTLLTACAQQPKTVGTEAFDDNLEHNVSMVCGYWPADGSSFLVCDIYNRAAKPLALWIIQKAETEDAKVTRETRAYKGNERKIHGSWKLSTVAKEETVTVRLIGPNGTIIKRKLK